MSDMNFFPQAFLVWSHAFAPGDDNVLQESNISGKHNRIAKLTGKYKPQGAISKVFGRIHGQAYDTNFLNLENYKLSALVPEIRLFRAKNNEMVPFYFPVASDYKLQCPNKTELNTSRSFSGVVFKLSWSRWKSRPGSCFPSCRDLKRLRCRDTRRRRLSWGGSENNA